MARLRLLLLASLLAACGRGPDRIDRTQPNALRKSELTSGSWYLQDTLVDVPPTSPVAVIGFGGALEKVRFEVQESSLVAYRTYELIPGMDPLVDNERSRPGRTVTLEGKPYKGAPVAAWKISSHFDRQRQYNAATGEQTNVVEENTTDRPWYEREFMRVEWGKNLVTNALSGTSGLDEPLQVYVTPIDQNVEDDALVKAYSVGRDAPELTYLDVTVRAFVEPPTIDYPGYGKLPYCFVDPQTDCASADVKLRTSLKKVDEARVLDYEPLPYSEKLEKKFGLFRAERLSYDRQRGVTESGRLLYAMRHNLWQRAHDAAGKTIPVAQREVRPIVYHLTQGFPAELLPAVRDLERSWDHAFRQAVAVPRGVAVDQVPQVFFVCESPVPEGAPEACGKTGTVARLGDLRFHLLPYIAQTQAGMPGLLGLGPSGIDPETGEVVQSVANIYGAGLDAWASNAQQLIDVLTGELSIEELISGGDSRRYVLAHPNPTDPRPSSGPFISSQPLLSEPTRRSGAFTAIKGPLAEAVRVFQAKGRPPVVEQDRGQVVESLISQSPGLEAELVNAPEVRALVYASLPSADFRARLDRDPALYRRVARETMLGVGPLQKLQAQRAARAGRYRHGCLYLAEFADGSWAGIAEEMAKRLSEAVTRYSAEGKPASEARALAKQDILVELRRLAFRSVAEHEVGHTVGLMHNFVGSFDALNYQDGYWDLRKQTIGVMVGGRRVLPSQPANLVAAAKQNQAQLDGRMRELQYASIMDYGARLNSAVHGLGKYDEAAILFSYAGGATPGYVEVFNQTRADYSDPHVEIPTDNAAKPLTVRGAHTEIPLAHVEHFTPVSTFYSDRFHYTTLPFHFAEKGLSFEAALEQGIARIGDRSYRRWSELEPVYNTLEEELHQWTLNAGPFTTGDFEKARELVGRIARGRPVEVPYMFCSDAEVGANVACNRSDEGADVYEITRNWLDTYQAYYPFTHFKRNRFDFSPQTVFDSTYRRYLGNLPNVYQQWLYNIYWLQSGYGLSSEELEDFFGVGDPLTQNYWTMAVIDGTNALLQSLATPSAGYHGKTAGGAWVHLPQNAPDNGRLLEPDGRPGPAESTFIDEVKAASGGQVVDVVYVPRGPGRSMYTLYDSTGHNAFERVTEVGHFFDQVAAMSALTTSETSFLGVDRGSDALRYSLPYFLTFGKELSAVFSDVWTDRRQGYAARLAKAGNGEASIAPPQLVRAENYVEGFVYPLPEVLRDEAGNVTAGEPVEASPTWGTRFYAELWGMAYFTANYDQAYARANQVYRLGSGEALTPATGFTVEQVDDPFGGYVYAALHRLADPEPSPAARMVIQARDLRAGWEAAKAAPDHTSGGIAAAEWESKTREAVRSLEMMRGLYAIFGNAQ